MFTSISSTYMLRDASLFYFFNLFAKQLQTNSSMYMYWPAWQSSHRQDDNYRTVQLTLIAFVVVMYMYWSLWCVWLIKYTSFILHVHMYNSVTYMYNSVTYMYNSVTYMYNSVTYMYEKVCAVFHTCMVYVCGYTCSSRSLILHLPYSCISPSSFVTSRLCIVAMLDCSSLSVLTWMTTIWHTWRLYTTLSRSVMCHCMIDRSSVRLHNYMCSSIPWLVLQLTLPFICDVMLKWDLHVTSLILWICFREWDQAWRFHIYNNNIIHSRVCFSHQAYTLCSCAGISLDWALVQSTCDLIVCMVCNEPQVIVVYITHKAST